MEQNVYSYKKLKTLNGPLRELDKLHFSHSSERVTRVKFELEHHQTILQNDRDNTIVLVQDKQL